MATNISEEIIEEVRSRNDIVNVISRYLDLKQTGANYVGLCPFHSEKTPSFTVTPSRQFYHCFGCGESGDVISFIMKMENLSFPEAVKSLGESVGISIRNRPVDKKKQRERERLFRLNREVAIFYYKNLLRNKRAQNYLLERSIKRDTIKNFGLGYALNSWNSLEDFLRKKGYDAEEVERAGLLSKRRKGKGYYDKFRDRIMFPIFDTRDRIIGFGGRVIDDSMPKYINSPDTLIFTKGDNLYGLNLAYKYSKRNKVVIVEGYTDVISLFNNGIRYAVASLGTAFTKQQAKLLRRYKDNVYICYDSDEAGLKAAYKAMNILKQVNINPKVLLLPEGKDPDDYINEYGKSKFEGLFDSALNYIDYTIFLNKRRYDLKSVEGKIKFSKNIAKTLKKVKSPIELDAYIDKISMETGISKEAIRKEIDPGSKNIQKEPQKQYTRPNYRNTKTEIKPVKSILESAHLRAEKTLINLIVKNESIYDRIHDIIKPEDFLNLDCREIANIVYDLYESEEFVDKSVLIKEIERKTDLNTGNVIEILNMDIIIPDDSIDKLVQDLINTINYFKLKMERKSIVDGIYKIDKKKEKTQEDRDKLKKLSLSLVEIDRKLKSHS